jgi:hypothetical protein
MYNELDLSDIKAKGWVRAFLQTQARGLTGEMGKVGEPFTEEYWGGPKDIVVGDDNFLGGLNSLNDAWVPFEQNGYWIDGMIRTARLIGDEGLLVQAKKKIYPAVENADEDGYIGPAFLKDGMVWAHSVFFRALIAEYTATKDQRILDALTKHYLRRPLKEVYALNDLRIISVRNVADIEGALWLYGRTGDLRLLQAAEESYEEFNRIYSNDDEADVNSKMRDLTLEGMLSNRKAKNNHGVTYCELCKLPAILYRYTGKEIYKKAAIHAFDKAVRDNMLVDGVISSTEYLNGNGDSHAMHETCDISDFTWAAGYLFMITGDPKYGDWVENAVFNAGLGAVDEDFKGEQYFSCPNQVICDDHSNHARFYKGADWMSYAPKKFLPCCAGNVHRFMPNFAARCWMKNQDELVAFTYVPSEISVHVGGKDVTVEEDTQYPFENTVRFKIRTQDSAAFTLVLRVPEWAVSSEISLNSERLSVCAKDRIYKIYRSFKDGDEIVISFQDEIRLIENAGGVSVKKGALLYALPVEENVVVNGLREMGNEDFPHYSLYPASSWNYGISAEDYGQAEFFKTEKEPMSEPWRKACNTLRIELPVYELPEWKLRTYSIVNRRLKPRENGVPVRGEFTFIPKVSDKSAKKIGKKVRVTLIPYAATRLRIAIFPKVER